MKNNYSRLKWVALIIIGGILFFLSKSATAATTTTLPLQQQEVSGIVTDTNGLPIPGVSIIVKNTTRGSVTNLDGEYSITTAANATLVFRYIGYKKQEIAVDGREVINVQLEEDIAALGEIQINAGYYNTTKRESTGNISRVTAEEIELQPVVNPIEALQGRMAGVEITPAGGNHPGAAPTIRIRGTNSLREEGNFPLYIIDGVPINSTPVESNSLISQAGIDPLNNLDVSNIKSIEILKDADATAIYGSRGANGVVLITTKQGSEMGTSLDARFYTGVATVPNRLDLMNTEEYLSVRRRAFENDGVELTERNAYDLLIWDQERYTDWQDFLFGGTSETTKANLTFSGGNKNTSFRLGGSYFSQGTVYPGDYDYQKLTGSLNLNHRSDDNKFQLDLLVNYGVDVNDLVGGINFNSSTALLPPNAPAVFNQDKSLNWEEWGAAGLDNPFAGYYNSTNTQTNNFISNLGLSYELLNGLQFKTSLGYTNYDVRELRKQPIRSYNPSSSITHKSFHLSSRRNSWIIEPQLNYTASWSKLNLNAIVGATLQENKDILESFQADGYASEALIGNIGAAESITNARRGNTTYRYAAIFSRIGLNWDRKYYLNFTGRRDGSSRFGPDNRFANFGAIGAGWIFSDEKFMEKAVPFLSFGKLRGSHGTTGNDQIGDYGYLDAYEATRGPGGLYPTGLANPNYSWEINKKLEGGIELGFIDDRIRLGLSYYRNRSSNQLVGYPLPAMAGFTSVQANLPATVENTGWEAELTSLNVDSENFRWQSSFNISFPKNELLSYPDIEQSSYSNTYRVGYPLNISLLYEYTGLDPETGLYTIRDINNDGSYDYQDRLIIENRNRTFFGGLSNNISYKNFSLQFLLEFVKQEGRLISFTGGNIANSTKAVLAGLEEDSPYQLISQSPASINSYVQLQNTIFPIVDASYLRLKTVSLSYNLSKNLLQQIGIGNCRLFVHGQNLLTASSYEGNPDRPYGTGIGELRTITGGLEINF
ncbi:SusC/RagA family TonB-linked outer membrane protein [Zunongwangia sp. HRR-M8]|uniref:SusC/RagA family TonB-linked outer membrane protein n=1 Tax=Zunongwangia sp. HRR-M8 TaxID=3015170 RepID=UPI0022DDD186|nr:SusC/RagA family TonB-linked outer membrane protein [Zunongwangia sp. HRR-M8]WBL22324.1 SusC/RagA family TonB-linked outer membrane protein [Zunongwangia sp. HRR-M8]